MPDLPSATPAATVRPAARLRGTLRLPGDKSITHRAMLLAAVAAGESRILGGSDGLDANSTAGVLEALGVSVQRLGAAEGGRVDRLVRSPGREGWREPAGVLDAGNSGTTLRLVAGLLAGTPLYAVVDGDASLRGRPVARIIEPLRRMGATLHARAADTLPPVTIVGRSPLSAIAYRMPVPSAQVKSAILLAGLSSEGTVEVREAVGTRDHTERMLRARGVDVRTASADGEWVVRMEGGATLQPRDERVPGDISAAAFWLVAGAAHPDASLTLESVGLNPTRRAIVDLLRRMGAQIREEPQKTDGAEPMATLTVSTSELRAIDLGPEEVARAIDEIPALCVAAACAHGTTHIRGAGELRRKESDRIAGIASGLAAFGARVDVTGDDLAIRGAADRPAFGLSGAAVHTLGDHRLAMAFAIAGLLARGETILDDAGSAAVSYPGFFTDLERVRA
ncbi:MAG: 3-phosphoshikimate 1-carboxyvinyltransferase [Candidatus Limnocylindrales bacterium]